MKQLKNRRGLTLIELLAGIVILAIIAAIAAVAIGNVINNSKGKAVLSDAVMVIEGAKLTNIEGACTAKDGGVTCTPTQLKPFVSGAQLENYGDVKFVKDATLDGGGVWQINLKKDEKNGIKNSKYMPAGYPGTVTEEALKKALDGQGKETGNQSAGGSK